MEFTQEQIRQLIAALIVDNSTGLVSVNDVRTVMLDLLGYTSQNETLLEAIRVSAQEALLKANSNESKDEEQDGRLTTNEASILAAQGLITSLGDRLSEIEDSGTSGLTPEERAANKMTRDANTARGNANASELIVQGNAILELQTEQTTQNTDITTAIDNARTAQETADAGTRRTDGILTRVGQNETNLSNHKTQEFDPLATRVGEAESEIDGLDTKTDTTDEEVARVRNLAQQAFDDHNTRGVTAEDFITEAGRLDAINPSQRYSGVNGDDPTFAQIELPLAAQFTDLTTQRSIRFSNGFLIPLFNDQGGAESEFYYVIEQDGRRIAGAGVPSTGEPTRLVVERDWVRVNVEDSSAELTFDALTGSNPVVKFAMIWTGTSGSFSPRLTAFDLHYIGRLRNPVAGVVRDVFGADIASLKTMNGTLTADIAGLTGRMDTVEQGVIDNAALSLATQRRINTRQFSIIENATIASSSSATIDPTALNNELGGGTAFARVVDGAVGNATQFLTRITDASQVLDYGAGRVLDVFNGRVRGFILRPARDAETREETKYITTDGGFGTRDEPAVLEFGNGAATPLPADNEVFLTQGIPPTDATITNISMAFGVRTNDNWAGIGDTLQFALRSGQSRAFAVPNVSGVTFTATAIADGRIRCRATHNGGGDPQALATNGGAIRFDAAYIETITTDAVQRGQETVDLGAFTGTNLVGFDAVQTGDNGQATAHYVTPAGRFDTGYFLLDVHRVAFATDNSAFTFFASDADTPLTQAVMTRLNGADEYLGLFTRNNHHADVLGLASGIRVPTTDGTKTYNVGDTLQRLDESITAGGFKGADGEDGVDGTDGQSLTIIGTWSNAIRYNNRDQVFYLPTRASYVSKVDDNAALPTDETAWVLVAERGETGATGPRGLQGESIQGERGFAGADGNDGADGAVGPRGLDGATGPRGLQGIQGLMGVQGEMGAMGATGATGATGAQGPRGLQGETGAAGAAGRDGVVSQEDLIVSIAGLPEGSPYNILQRYSNNARDVANGAARWSRTRSANEFNNLFPIGASISGPIIAGVPIFFTFDGDFFFNTAQGATRAEAIVHLRIGTTPGLVIERVFSTDHFSINDGRSGQLEFLNTVFLFSQEEINSLGENPAISLHMTSQQTTTNFNIGDDPVCTITQAAAIIGPAGPQGEAGADGEDGEAGANGTGFRPRGAWSSAQVYSINDIITQGGATYRALATSGSQISNQFAVSQPGFGSDWRTYWELWAGRGTDGEDGTDGAAGARGIGFDWNGAWIEGGRYAVNDIVEYQGTSYIVVSGGVKTTPPDASDSFAIFASGGNNGRDGENGSDGRSLTVRGAWVGEGTLYTTGDIVEYQGTSYIAQLTHNSFSIPPQSHEFVVLAAKGADGTDGTGGGGSGSGGGSGLVWLTETYTGSEIQDLNDNGGTFTDMIVNADGEAFIYAASVEVVVPCGANTDPEFFNSRFNNFFTTTTTDNIEINLSQVGQQTVYNSSSTFSANAKGFNIRSLRSVITNDCQIKVSVAYLPVTDPNAGTGTDTGGGGGESRTDEQVRALAKEAIEANDTIISNTQGVARNAKAVFGDTISGIWDESSNFDGSLAEAQALMIGDIVQSERNNGTIEYYELIKQNITTATSTFYPGSSTNSGEQTWKLFDYTTGVVELVDSKTTKAEAKTQATDAITESLAEGGDIERAIAAISPTGGVSLEAIANEMRADGDVATIPAETLPNSAQITATAEAQTDIIVPDNALFRGLSTVNASFSSTIINAGNSINVGIRYTDDDTIPPTGGLRPAFTNSTIRNFTGIDLTRPIAFFFGMGEIQDITVGDLSFTNTKTGTGSLVDEIQTVARTIVLDQVASDITLGGDPVMGGGVRYRTFYADLTSNQLIAGSTQNFTIPDGLDAEVTYLTWAALVLTASTTASNATLWGGDIGASANDRGAVSLTLNQRGSGGQHSFGIARQTHGNAVRIGTRTGTPSSETVVRVSITVRQGGALKLPT